MAMDVHKYLLGSPDLLGRDLCPLVPERSHPPQGPGFQSGAELSSLALSAFGW